VQLKVEGIGDVTINSLLAGGANVSLKNIIDGVQSPLYMQSPALNYWYSYLDTYKTLYLKYNSCQNMSSQSFSDFAQGIQDFMATHIVEKFVIDVRNNGGGSSGIISSLFFLQSSALNQKGKLFVITGRQTFSSALMNAIQFRQNTNCLLIGEPTGGKPNSYGEVLSFTLPNSGVVVQYSTKYFQMMDDDPLSLYPDNDIELSIQDFAQGKDPVMDFILNYK
jgi:C-terminal processing protease CtpA/Prc